MHDSACLQSYSERGTRGAQVQLFNLLVQRGADVVNARCNGRFFCNWECTYGTSKSLRAVVV